MLANVADCLADHLKTFLLYYNIVNTNHISYNEYFLKNIVLSSYHIQFQSKALTIIEYFETSLFQIYVCVYICTSWEMSFFEVYLSLVAKPSFISIVRNDATST